MDGRSGCGTFSPKVAAGKRTATAEPPQVWLDRSTFGVGRYPVPRQSCLAAADRAHLLAQASTTERPTAPQETRSLPALLLLPNEAVKADNAPHVASLPLGEPPGVVAASRPHHLRVTPDAERRVGRSPRAATTTAAPALMPGLAEGALHEVKAVLATELGSLGPSSAGRQGVSPNCQVSSRSSSEFAPSKRICSNCSKARR